MDAEGDAEEDAEGDAEEDAEEDVEEDAEEDVEEDMVMNLDPHVTGVLKNPCAPIAKAASTHRLLAADATPDVVQVLLSLALSEHV